jgi:urease accessory protein
MHPTGRHGKLKLAFAKRQNRTVMTESFFQVPLQVMKPFHDDTGALSLYLLSPTGGVVQGDDYQMQVSLSAETHVLLTTQAATKVYRMPKRGAHQRIHFHVGANATLEYLPDPTILFQDANFDQLIDLVLEPGASAVVQEILMPGRLARGEAFAFTRYRTRLEASDEKGLFLYDAACLQPRENPHLTALGVLDSYPCWGTLYLLGNCEPTTSQWDDLCAKAEGLLSQEGKSIGGLSRLHRSGIVVRMLAHHAHRIQSAFQTVWNLFKTEVLGLKTIDLRKY